MKRSIAVVATTAAAALAAPAAQAATLAVDPARPCYRETTPSFCRARASPPTREWTSKNGSILPVDPPILADPAGLVQATLTLPGWSRASNGSPTWRLTPPTRPTPARSACS